MYDCSFACRVLCSIKSWALISGLVLLTISCNVHSLFLSMPFCRFQLKLHIVYFFVCMPTLVNLLISRCLQFEHIYMVLLFESNERLALNSFSWGHEYCKQVEEFRITSWLRLQPLPVFYHCVQVHSSKYCSGVAYFSMFITSFWSAFTSHATSWTFRVCWKVHEVCRDRV